MDSVDDAVGEVLDLVWENREPIRKLWIPRVCDLPSPIRMLRLVTFIAPFAGILFPRMRHDVIVRMAMNIDHRHYFFLDKELPDDVCDTDLQSYFLEYSPVKWNSETNGGSFMARDSDRMKHGLILSHHPEHGICLTFTKSLKFDYETWVSVGDENRMNETVVIDGEVLLPVGSFVSPLEAWPLVSAYIRNPLSFCPQVHSCAA